MENRMKPNQITARKAGWPSQLRLAVSVFWSGVCEFFRSAYEIRWFTPVLL